MSILQLKFSVNFLTIILNSLIHNQNAKNIVIHLFPKRKNVGNFTPNTDSSWSKKNYLNWFIK